MVQRNLDGNPALRDALLREIADAVRAGDTLTGRSMLEDYFPDMDFAGFERAVPPP